MGLYKEIEQILRANGGEVAFDYIVDSLRYKYAKETIREFIADNELLFGWDGFTVQLYSYPVDYLQNILDDCLSGTKVDADSAFYLIAYYLFVKRQFPEVETEQLSVSYRMIRESGFYNVKEPEFWKFSKNELKLLLQRLDHFIKDSSFLEYSHEACYSLTSEFYEYYINTSALTRGQFSSPESLIRLICEMISDDHTLSVYNPAAGMLKLLTAINIKRRGDIHAVASEIHKGTFEIGTLFAATNGFRPDFRNEDSIDELDQLGPNEFDLVVSVPPFNAKFHPRYGNYESYNDVALDIISSSLYKLRDAGKAFFLVVDGVLFSETKNHRRFRKEIIESKMLHTVISLPGNLFYPFTGVKTSLLIFEKGRKRSVVRFIDASNEAFYSSKKKKAVSLEVKKILELFEGGDDHFSYDRDNMIFETKTSLVVDYEQLKKNDYSLSIREYLMHDAQQVQDLGSVELGHILKKLQLPMNHGVDIPYLRITDLNGGYMDSPDGLAKNRNRTKGRILEEKAVLIGLVGGSSKPSLYNSTKVVEVSTNIAVFKPDTRLVDLDYLLQELNSVYIKDQFEFMAVGSTSLRHLKVSDLLRTKIKLPPLAEQRRLADERMQFLREQQIPVSGKTDGVSAQQVIKTLKHEIGNILAGPSGLLNLLPKFLVSNNIALDTPSASYGNARSIGERIAGASSDISKVNQIMGTMEGILLAESSSFSPERTEIITYLRKRLEKASEHREFDFYVGVHSKYDSEGRINAEIDKAQFDHLVDNIIINAVEHSDDVDGKLLLVVNVVVVESEKSKDVEIHFMNNGNELPADFSIDDYVGFSRKSGSSRGQGIGGFLVNRITLNHHGKLSLMPSSSFKFRAKDEDVNFKSNFEIVVTIPQKQ